MLKRVFIDNFRAFVNFNLTVGRQQLILGSNGTGKSTLLDVLSSIKKLVVDGDSPDLLFPEESCTRWQSLNRQGFELELELQGSVYLFRLELDRHGTPSRTRIVREAVYCDQKPIFDFRGGEVRLYNNNFEEKVLYPFNWFQSALNTIQARPENRRLMSFKQWLESLTVVQIAPRAMLSKSDKEAQEPVIDFGNFASWYRHVSQEQGEETQKLRDYLAQIIPGFRSLDSVSVGGNAREVRIRVGPSSSDSYALHELSDGQRALICLYAILVFIVKKGGCAIIDEPDNFVSISEIQPWLMELQDYIDESGGQVLLISHNPELIDYLAHDIGIVFDRDGPGPVRSRDFESLTKLEPAEELARGWNTREQPSR